MFICFNSNFLKVQNCILFWKNPTSDSDNFNATLYLKIILNAVNCVIKISLASSNSVKYFIFNLKKTVETHETSFNLLKK